MLSRSCLRGFLGRLSCILNPDSSTKKPCCWNRCRMWFKAPPQKKAGWTLSSLVWRTQRQVLIHLTPEPFPTLLQSILNELWLNSRWTVKCVTFFIWGFLFSIQYWSLIFAIHCILFLFIFLHNKPTFLHLFCIFLHLCEVVSNNKLFLKYTERRFPFQQDWNTQQHNELFTQTQSIYFVLSSPPYYVTRWWLA